MGLLSLLVPLASCGGEPLPYQRRPTPVIIPAQQPRAQERVVRAAPPPSPEIAFARTPITETAEALSRLAVSAAMTPQIDPSPIATRRPLGTPGLEVDWSSQIDGRPRGLEVLGLALEIEIVLKRGTPPDHAEGRARWGSVRATLALSRNGLRLVELRGRAMEPDLDSGRAPQGFAGLDELVAALLNDLADGDMASYRLNQDDRALLNNDTVWARVEQDFSTGQLEEVREMVRGLPREPLGIRLDDVSVLVRDERHRLLSLSMDFDPRGESFVLATAPLVRVAQLWPRQ